MRKALQLSLFWKSLVLFLASGLYPLLVSAETTTDEEQVFCSYDSNTSAGCATNANITFFVTQEGCMSAGIEVYLDIDDNGNMDANNRNESGNSLLSSYGAQLTGTFPNFTISGGKYPIGQHLLEVHIPDTCSNDTTIRHIPFSIKDCQAPPSICVNGLAVGLAPVIPTADVDGDGDMESAATVIWATDATHGQLMSDCSGTYSLAIYRGDDPALANPDFIPSVQHNHITVTCDDANQIMMIRLYTIDGAGNFNFCDTYALIQNNLENACQPVTSLGAIGGKIRTEQSKPLADVLTQLSGPKSEMKHTNADGSYDFAELEMGHNYSVTPMLDDNARNGVSTYDLVLMVKHILGVQSITSPYQLIAADVNNSGNISILDLIYLRRLILTIDIEFANNSSWRFVDASYQFPDPTNPWVDAFPEIKGIDNLSADKMDLDFIAIKVGDLNFSAITDYAQVIEERSARDTLYLEVENQNLEAGRYYKIDFHVNDLASVQGWQGTLVFDPRAAEFIDIEEGIAKKEHFGLHYLESGVITTSWNVTEEKNTTKDAFLFSLVFKANMDTEVKELLGMDSRYTKAEAYTIDNHLLHLGIRFTEPTEVPAVAKSLQLEQNKPNPFSGQTVIGFNLPAAAEATLTIYDFTGRPVKQIKGCYSEGYNKIEINSNELPSGVLTYTLQSSGIVATKKMVVGG